MDGRSVSHYKIEKKIGGGGMGVVYKAVDTKLGRPVALKFLPPEYTGDEGTKKRFLHEAQAAAALEHPNICSIYEIDETPTEQLFISMAYYDGVSLKELIREGPVPVRHAFEIAFSIADGLALAHERGIIHRDIKPANIMITVEGFVKIVDFGLAKLRGRSAVTRSGTTLGTVAYMSPEQARSNDVDHRTDIWSLGVLLYESLTGSMPFRGDIEPAALYSILNEDPRPVRELRPEIPPEFARIIHKCLEKDVTKRYQDAAGFLADLRGMARKLGWQSSGSVRSVIRVGQTSKTRGRLRLAGIIVAVLAVSALFVWSTFKRTPDVYSTKTRLAFLPLDNMVGSDLSDAFVAGLSEELAELLDRVSGFHNSMWVVPYSMTQSGRLATRADARDMFGVNRLLTGSVQNFGDGMRLSLEMLDATSLAVLTTTDVDFQLEDLASLPQEIVRHTADVLNASLSENEVSLITRGATADAQALRLYMEGHGFLQRAQVAGNLDRAIAAFEDAVTRDPYYAKAKAALAYAHWERGESDADRDLRASSFAASLEAAMTDTSLIYPNTVVADLGVRSKAYDEVLTACRRILAVDPHRTSAYRRMTDAYEGMQRYDEAESCYRKIVAAKPDYFMGYKYMGYYFKTMKHEQNAIEQYDQVLRLAPNDWWTLRELANIHHRHGDFAEARQLYLRVFAIQPDCSAAQHIGTLFYAEGQFADAARYYELALSYCDSTNASYYENWNNLAEALYWTEGRRDESYDKYRRAITYAERQRLLEPNDARLLAYLAGCYAALGEQNKAETLVMEASALGEDNGFVQFLVAWTYEKLDRRKLALHHIGNALRHRFPVSHIETDPMMSDLIQDIRFKQLVEGMDPSSNERESATN